MSTKNRKIWAAWVLLILTVAAAIGFLFRLSQPDQEQRSVYLNCTESDRGGWVFFTEAGPVEPVFGFGGYINGIPAEGPPCRGGARDGGTGCAALSAV